MAGQPGAPNSVSLKYNAIYRDGVSSKSLGALPFPSIGKGQFRFLVLRMLKEGPVHGYEIMKLIEARFHGVYTPSPGSVYPTLRSLLREGCVAVAGTEGRKVYRITGAGRLLIRRREKEIDRRFRAFEAALGPERAALVRELRLLAKVLAPSLRTITPDQAKRLYKVVVDMRGRVTKILTT